jgi:hypothetical protein
MIKMFNIFLSAKDSNFGLNILFILEGILDPGQRAHVDTVSSRGRVLLGADAAAGHDAGVGEAGARGAGDPRDGAQRCHGHAHRRADHQGHQRRAAEAREHLHRDAHPAAAAVPRRANQRARQRRLLPRHEPHHQDRRPGEDDGHRRRAPAQRRRLRALPRALLASGRQDRVLCGSVMLPR